MGRGFDPGIGRPRQNDAISDPPQAMHHIVFGSSLLLQNHSDAKDGWDKNAICNFVTKASVDGALPEQQHIS